MRPEDIEYLSKEFNRITKKHNLVFVSQICLIIIGNIINKIIHPFFDMPVLIEMMYQVMFIMGFCTIFSTLFEAIYDSLTKNKAPK